MCSQLLAAYVKFLYKNRCSVQVMAVVQAGSTAGATCGKDPIVQGLQQECPCFSHTPLQPDDVACTAEEECAATTMTRFRCW